MLSNATLSYVKLLANKGNENAIQQDPILSTLNTYQGKIVNKRLSESLGFTTG